MTLMPRMQIRWWGGPASESGERREHLGCGSVLIFGDSQELVEQGGRRGLGLARRRGRSQELRRLVLEVALQVQPRADEGECMERGRSDVANGDAWPTALQLLQLSLALGDPPRDRASGCSATKSSLILRATAT